MNGLLFSLWQPVFHFNRLDVTGNLLMLSGLQQKLAGSQGYRLAFDLVYLLMPCLLTLAVFRYKKAMPIVALLTSLFGIVYNYYYSIMTFISIEVLIAWMFVPLIFCVRSAEGFYFSTGCIRVLFSIFFLSAGLWKIRAGGIFNPDQMSAILLNQHAYILVNDNNWFCRLVRFLIEHRTLSYLLYLAATVAELA